MDKKTLSVIALVVVIALAGIIGWRMGQNNSASKTTQPTSSTSESSNTSASTGDPKTLVSYTLPDGWKEGTCPDRPGKTYLTPSSASLDCNANPSAPVALSIDPQNATDCQQLANPQNVRKHTCVSLTIDNRKSLSSTTEFTKTGGRTTDETVSSYYIDTGKGVVQVDYSYTSNNEYQNVFDQFAKSLKVKG